MSKPLTETREATVAVVQEVYGPRSALFSPRTRVGRSIWFLILLTLAFSKPLIALVMYAASSNLYSYILLVPVISGYLIYSRRNQLPKTYGTSPGAASIAFLVGTVTLVLATTVPTTANNNYFSLVALSFFCFALSGGFFFLGRWWMSAAAFPVFFLIFAVPMPDAMADALETASKVASAEAANLFFNITGTPTLRDGTFFQLPNIAIRVAQECSGIRSSLVLVLTSLVAANLFLKSGWRRVLLVGFVIPLGIIRNGFRIWVIGTLCIHFGPQMIHSIIHRRGGPLFFALSLIPLFALLWWLWRSEDRGQRTEDRGQKVVSGP